MTIRCCRAARFCSASSSWRVNLLVDLHLRPHQSAHQAQPMTAETLDTPVVAVADGHAPSSAARILGLFQRQSRGGRRARGDRRGRAGGHPGGCHRAAFALSHRHRGRSSSRRSGRTGGSLTYPLGTDRDRPRHPLAPHLRRAPVADHRHRGGGDLDRPSAPFSASSPGSCAASPRSSSCG